MKNDTRIRVLIVGGNFAGLKTALNLSRKFNVTVIDKRPWFEFLPNIHELVSGIKTPAMLRHSINAIVKGKGHRFLWDQVIEMDPENNHAVTASGEHLPYDFCVVAIGGVNNTFGVPGAKKYALPFKTVGNCYRIGRKVKQLSRTGHPFHIVVVGSGLEGIETLGEIMRGYRKEETLRVHIVEREQHILPETAADIESAVKKHCSPYAVDWFTGTTVEDVTPKTVLLSNGHCLKSDMTIWTGGVKPNPFLKSWGFTTRDEQWVPVRDSLQHVGYDTVFFAGDAADAANVHSKQAYHAMDMGRCAAENITRLNAGRSLKPFKPSARPTIISFGDLDAFLVVGKTALAGSALNALKEAVFQKVMTDFDPSGLLVKAFHLSNRAGRTAIIKGLPLVLSPRAMLRLKNVRILPRRSEKEKPDEGVDLTTTGMTPKG